MTQAEPIRILSSIKSMVVADGGPLKSGGLAVSVHFLDRSPDN